MRNKIIIIIFIIFLYKQNLCLCENLTLDQKIVIFGELIQNHEPQFHLYLMNKTLDIYQFLVIAQDSYDIQFYIWLLEQDFYKN